MAFTDKFIREKLMHFAMSTNMVDFKVEVLPHDGIFGMVRERITVERLVPEVEPKPPGPDEKVEKPIDKKEDTHGIQ